MEADVRKTKMTVIPARRKRGNTAAKKEIKKLRVAAYCRVSTDTDEQATSYEVQVSHYRDFIKQHTDWELAGIYADDGISGTNIKKREEFKRMIQDCMDGKIDMVITKSISRFARNTVDCLQYIRKLKDKNIPIIFEKENINTMDAKGELLITIMSSLAQQESQSLSQNVKLGYQFRFQQGKMTVNYSRFLGYTKNNDGELVIVPAEAEVVKRIYREYLEGKSTQAIADGLMEDGILTGAGKRKWYGTTVEKILRNEKYIGDALLQKTYTVDCLTKQKVINDGIVPQYYVENHHDAIIPRELYYEVQAEIIRRANLRDDKNRRRGYCGKYALTGRLICGECGEHYRRVVWDVHGRKEPVWRCVSRVKKERESCNAITLHEDALQDAIVRGVRQVFNTEDSVYREIQSEILQQLGGDQTTVLQEFDDQLEELQERLLSSLRNSQSYDSIADQIKDLREQREQAATKQAVMTDLDRRIQDLQQFMKEKNPGELKFSDGMVRQYIDQITVYPDHLHIAFRAGLETDVWG